MRPLQITFRGLRSYTAEQTIDFRGHSLIGITGDTGAGKSTIFAAINFALFGTCTFEAPSPKVLIADGGDGTLAVSFTFEARGREWTVNRRISNTTTTSVHRLEAADGSETVVGRDVTARVQELIGLDQKTFLRSVLLPQGKFEQLLHAPTAERAKMLKGLLGLDVLNDIATIARERLDRLDPLWRDLDVRRRALLPDPRATAAGAGAALAAAEKRIEQLKTAQEGIATITAQRTAADKDHTALARSLKELAAAETDAAARLHTLAQLDAELAAREKDLRIQLVDQQHIHTRLLEQLGERRPDGTLAILPDTARPLLAQLRERSGQHARMLVEQERESLALTSLAAEVGAAGAESDGLKRKLDAAEKELVTSGETWKGVEGEVEGYRRDLEALRQLLAQIGRLHGDVAENLAAHGKANDALAIAAQTAKDARSAESDLEAALEHQKRLNSAAHAAAGLQPGDACPVCVRELPGDFRAPAETSLAAADNAHKKARIQARKAAEAEATAVGAERAANSLAAKAEQDLSALIKRFAAAQAELASRIGAFDPADTDDHILAAHLHRLERAQAEVKAATGRAGEIRDEAAAAAAKAASLGEDLVRRTGILNNGKRQLEAFQSETSMIIAAIAPSYRPADSSIAAIEECDRRAVADKKRLVDDWKQLSDIEEIRQRLQDQLTEVDKLRKTEVGVPAKSAQQQALTLANAHAAVAALLHITPAPPIDLEADVAGQAQWAADVEQRARDILRESPARLAALERSTSQLDAAADEIRRKAPTDGKSIDEALTDAIGDRREEQKSLQIAIDQIDIVDDLQSRLDATKPHLDALAELVRLLADGQFVAAAVAERQRALLATSTSILREMTAGRFAFGPDFRIYDNYTGQLREAKTLSGGETFQASLALALAVVEQAGASGGRSESLFLDEGFGTLDQAALSYALDALSTQVTAGRLVVVISHMRAVAQQVPALLRVTKSATGSAVRWATDEELAQLADESYGDGLHD
ncbi:exonuclease SbcC [Hamadaea flava]|uniref:Nuclease SbcCD subunit C n=1 Tax=Hamadaea flava TaxID=1742688 RepID=A0ABV8LXS4_9ACTN|nr:SMC family ATPase [Hamadaea flava]MCP2323446.1 exonuclease SbcC [Hamadaea flava]